MIDQWHHLVKTRDLSSLTNILAPDVVLHSPVIHTPVPGQKMVALYLTAAFNTFLNESFTYVNEFASKNAAVLEFTVEIDGIKVNGIDMITWNDEGKISEFKVMVRPIKALNLINDKMTAMLEVLKKAG